MAIHAHQKKQQIEAIRENIIAIEYCLKFDKLTNSIWTEKTEGCLGYPAFILICSVFDTIGSYFRKTNTQIPVNGEYKKIVDVGDHFLILNHPYLFNCKLSGTTIYDFYTTYRSRMTHNNALPKNNFLEVNPDSDKVFSLNNLNGIESINLISLFNLLESKIDIFIHLLKTGNWSEDHYLTKDLQDKEKNQPINIINPKSSSGYTSN